MTTDREQWDEAERAMLDDLKAAERDGAEWIVPSHVEGLEVDGLLIDLEVRFIWPGDDPPQVVRLSRLERADGAPLGAGDLSLDLRDVAVAAVAEASDAVEYRAEDGSYRVGDPEGWRVAARAVRAAAFGHGRLTWTTEVERWLAATWRHAVECDRCSAATIADALGTTASRVRARLSHLRKLWGEDRVPPGLPGRPREHDEREEDN